MTQLPLILAALLCGALQEDSRVVRMKKLEATIHSPVPDSKRIQALYEYTEIARDKEALPFLTAILSDESPNMRGLAARRIGAMGEAAAVSIPELRERLTDPGYRVRPISNHLAMARAVRFDVAEALGLIGPKAHGASAQLSEIARTDMDPEVRISASLALLRIHPEDDRPIEGIVRELCDDKKGTAGPLCAADALRQLGRRAETAFDAVVRVSAHRDEFVRMAAIDALIAIDPKAAVETVTLRLSDKDAQVCEAASEGLGTLGPLASPAVPSLVRLISDDSDILRLYVRKSAARTLGLIGTRASTAIPYLERVAADPGDEELQSIAKKSLRQIRPVPTNRPSEQTDEPRRN